MSYVQHQQLCQIQQKMRAIMAWEVWAKGWKEMVNKLILYNLLYVSGKQRKDLQIICPFHEVFFRKLKMWRYPHLNWENSWSFMMQVVVVEKLPVMRQVLKLKELTDLYHQSWNQVKIHIFFYSEKWTV